MTLTAVTDAILPNDLNAYWMPFTANRAFKQSPRLIAYAKYMHYFTPDGRAIVDGTGGLWRANAAHYRAPIVEAIRTQAGELDFAPPFQFGHPKAFALANRIAALAPGDLNHVFFTDSGSEAVDTALKLAIAYHSLCGEGARQRLIGRERGDHGSGFGGMAVGGIAVNRRSSPASIISRRPMIATNRPTRRAIRNGERILPMSLKESSAGTMASTIAAVIVASPCPAPMASCHPRRAISSG